MKTLLGYADRISTRHGEPIAFKVSSTDAAPYTAQIVRLINADTNPAGPGYHESEVAGAAWNLPGRKQHIHPGSCLVIPSIALPDSFALSLLIWPTTPQKPGQTLASHWCAHRQAGFILSLDGPNGLTMQLGDGAGGAARATLGKPVLDRHWYRIHASFDATTGSITLRQTALLTVPGIQDHGALTAQAALSSLGHSDSPLLFAARLTPHGAYAAFYNGKLEAPEFSTQGIPIAAWDFSQGIGTALIHDITGTHHGHTHQRPARAMTGHDWDGSETNWRHAPAQYGAIHLHDDDIDDAGWGTDFTYTPSHDLPSGLYAARLTSASDEDYIPFVLRPTAPMAKLLVIIPTASYQAYANEHLAFDAAIAERVHDHLPIFGPNDIYLAAHRELGGSLYDRHSDTSGIFASSRLRPILNMRPKYQSWLGGTGSALWQLAADTHLLAWLHHEAIDSDCICDEDLHAEGAAALAPYACVMTATHAEYWSTNMRDALDTYRDAGGRIMHMGGNGLYWRIAYAENGTIDVRRCEVGNGWITAPGESYHELTGEYGGLWRRLGRPPQQSVGVGFAGQGFDRSSYYRRLPDSFSPRAAFIFDGVDTDIIGDFGLIGGGAAGIELDRTDFSLGTPPNTLVLARSEAHTNTYLPSVEELLINYLDQATLAPVYGELIFFETQSGGAVFATGSIAWAGSLSHENYRNSVAQITANVLHRFLDPTSFCAKEPD